MLTRSDEESGERWLEGRLQVKPEQAENDALQALFEAALEDKYSGPPFKVARITANATNTVIHSFKEAFLKCAHNSSLLSEIRERALFLIYPAKLAGKDDGEIIFHSDETHLSRAEVEWWGHPVAYLWGGYYLHMVTFKRQDQAQTFWNLPRKRVIQEKPIFYCLDEDWNNNLLRSYRLKICAKRWSHRIPVCHEIFMAQVTAAFVKQLGESFESFLEHS